MMVNATVVSVCIGPLRFLFRIKRSPELPVSSSICFMVNNAQVQNANYAGNVCNSCNKCNYCFIKAHFKHRKRCFTKGCMVVQWLELPPHSERVPGSGAARVGSFRGEWTDGRTGSTTTTGESKQATEPSVWIKGHWLKIGACSLASQLCKKVLRCLRALEQIV